MRYSIDFRKKILSIRRAKKLSIRVTAERFDISPTTINSWLRCIEAKKPGPKGSTRKITREMLEKDVALYPDDYIHERAERLSVANNTIWRNLKHFGFTYKKNMGSSKSR